MKILVTGAHFTPAQAVIEEFKKKPGIKLVYVGRSTTLEGDPSPSVESQVLPKLGVKFIPILSGRLQRSFAVYTIPSLLKIPIGFIQALYIILKEKPDVVLSFGGYVAVPIVTVSWLFSIPVIVHEQALQSGLANKISAIFADKIALAFADNGQFLGKNIVHTGNPIRKEILYSMKNSLDEDYQKLFAAAKKEHLPVVLVTGGNQGSHAINLAVESCLKDLLKISCVIHQTGQSSFKDFDRLSHFANEYYLVRKWIGDEMGTVLSRVDLVISRAGINTLTELAYFMKPTLVIPIPFQDEQNKNAKYFESLGLAKVLHQDRLSGDVLLKQLKMMLNDSNHLNQKAKNAKKIVIPDSAKRLALETLLLLYN